MAMRAERVRRVVQVMQPAMVLLLLLLILQLCNGAAAAGRPRKTTMRFYMHNVMKGENSTAVPITAPSGNMSEVGFGSAFAIDDLLTRGPLLQKSKPVGRAQGFFMWDNARMSRSSSSPCLLLFITCAFNENTSYGNSSVIVQGSVGYAQALREVAIVGGTGRFRMAQGFAEMDPVSMSPGAVVLKISATIFH